MRLSVAKSFTVLIGCLIGARGRTRAGTVEGLSFVPLHWATRALRLVPTAGFAPGLCAF